MKIIAMLGAGMLVATGVAAAAPAEAQRHGWHDRGRGWDGHRGWRGDRRWDRGPGWNRGWDRGPRWNRGWNGNRGWRGDRGFYGRSRTVCRWVDGYYGPQRRCFRVR